MEDRQDEDQTSDVETAESVAGSPGLGGKECNSSWPAPRKDLGSLLVSSVAMDEWPSELVLYLEADKVPRYQPQSQDHIWHR